LTCDEVAPSPRAYFDRLFFSVRKKSDMGTPSFDRLFFPLPINSSSVIPIASQNRRKDEMRGSPTLFKNCHAADAVPAFFDGYPHCRATSSKKIQHDRSRVRKRWRFSIHPA
jgi:hypothetical protein